MKKPTTIYLKDYMPPDFLVDHVFLYFDLHENLTTVKSVLVMQRNPNVPANKRPLILDGENLLLKSVILDGQALTPDQYEVDDETLTIKTVPDAFKLEIEVAIKPEENTKLTGLYKSRGNYCTQCESHGFRRITYFLDRPDVLTRFTTCISADKSRYPILLSNGNLTEQKQLPDHRHWVKWEDPSLKPCYLFALVAGNFQHIDDVFVTHSGRKVKLFVYVEKGKLDQAHFAMESLKQAMRWDEEKFGREYDLDIFMIVAVGDFNFGAMENKGLNIFNDRYILAKPETATDDDYLNIQSVIGHEYFHNWSGNRVTTRDWFQITLKEGLTIFRDQSFTSDLNSAVVERIRQVHVITTAQFAQDAGPMAHSIRPDHYIEINNFYTVTVYNKGAEVIRMMQTILGKAKFRQAMDLYFARNDGKAVTSEDFVKAMEDASGIDLTQFRRWYTQAGTPVLDITSHYNEKEQTYTLSVAQSCPPTPGQSHKENFHIPLLVGLLDKSGKDIPLQLKGETAAAPGTTAVLNIKNKTDKFEFINVFERPVPSLLRNFSAPVKLNYPYTDEELLFLLKHDSDDFNRWDAGQKLAVKIIQQLIVDYQQQRQLVLNPAFVSAFKSILNNEELDPALLAKMLTLPKIAYLLELTPVADIDAIYHVRQFIETQLVQQLQPLFLETYKKNRTTGPYHFDGKSVGRRALKNLSLYYLMQLNESETRTLCMRQFQGSNNMTDVVGALIALIGHDCAERTTALAEFYEKWKQEDLVVDKWFSLHAFSDVPDALATVKKLLLHPAFSYKNPNRIRALVGAFSQGNYINFHAKDGSGYEFLADQVLIINSTNPQVAARLLEPLTRWRKFDKNRQELMKAQLERIVKAPQLSKDVYEIATKSLQG